MIDKVGTMTHQDLLTVRANAVRMGDEAQPLVTAIDERLASFEASGGMASHRAEFARSMLALVAEYPRGQWVASRDLYVRAKERFADNPYVGYVEENSARAIPLTKALESVRDEFPGLEHRKDGSAQGAPVFYRMR